MHGPARPWWGTPRTIGPVTSTPPEPRPQSVEAARYALLRRLSGAMRQHMVGPLQPIGLLTQLMERRLREERPDVARLGEDLGKVQGFARTGVAANLDMVSWLAPEPGVRIALEGGARECMDLLRGDLVLRGLKLRLPEGAGIPVARHAIRTLLSAVLLALADEARAPAELVLRPSGARLQVQVHSLPSTGAPGVPAQPSYRALDWAEVLALGEAEQVRLARSSGAVDLHFTAG